MRRLILLETKMWWRNSRLLILFFLFAFFGITSPVLIYYMKEFLATFWGDRRDDYSHARPQLESFDGVVF